MVNRIWPTAVASEADGVSSVSASACQIGGPIDVNPGELTLVYGTMRVRHPSLMLIPVAESIRMMSCWKIKVSKGVRFLTLGPLDLPTCRGI